MEDITTAAFLLQQAVDAFVQAIDDLNKLERDVELAADRCWDIHDKPVHVSCTEVGVNRNAFVHIPPTNRNIPRPVAD